MLVGTLGGALNGFLIARVTVSPILATLGTHILFVGIASAVTGGSSVPVMVSGYARLGVVTMAGIPLIFLLAVIAFVAVGFLLTRTRIGREIYLYGSNPVAARFAGLRSERAVMVTYMIAGALVSVAGLIMVARFNSARVGFGGTYLLQAILVVVLAGFDPFGGRGRVANLAVGVLLLQALQSGFTVKGFNPFVKNLVWGSVLLIVMVVNFWAARTGSRRAEPLPARPQEVPEVTDDEHPVPV
jgi:simple sugar transport system permease protein